MEDSTFVLIISFSIIIAIAAFCVWYAVKDKLRFKRMHRMLVERWDGAAAALRLSWVVPIDHVRETKAPPALTGTIGGRDVYVALQDESSDESLRAKWFVVVHLGVAKELVPRRERGKVLKKLKKGRGAVAKVKKRQMVVHRAGLQADAEWIKGLVEECLNGASQLEEVSPSTK